jgi:outer membrane beta-barrel protein
LAFLLLLAPIVAHGQAREEPGLDLTQPAPPRPQAAPPPPAAGAPRPAEEKAQQTAPIAPGEGDVALGDRVKAVQRKGFLKRHRLELGVDFPFTVNDAFYEKLGLGGKLAYHLEDSFALSLHGTYWWQLRTDHAREGKLAFSSQLLNSALYGQLMLDGIWSPIYGKLAWLGSSIVHFDVYLLAGFGVVWSATSVSPRSEGPHPAAEFGGGIRFYPNSWLAIDAGLVASIYADQPNTSFPSTLQKVIAPHLGLSFFLPTSFEYVYP